MQTKKEALSYILKDSKKMMSKWWVSQQFLVFFHSSAFIDFTEVFDSEVLSFFPRKNYEKVYTS